MDRLELQQPTSFGTLPIKPNELIERRGGRFLPSLETSRSELHTLIALADLRTHPNILFSEDLLLIPSSKQLARIAFFSELGCWDLPIYRDTKNRARYGNMSVHGIPSTHSLAHRTMYKVFFGLDSLPNGSADFLDHVCERKSCCYPRHLERVTHYENDRRGHITTDHDHPRLDIGTF